MQRPTVPLDFRESASFLTSLASSFSRAANGVRHNLHMHGDPGDRFIVATALTHGATLMTADEKIRSMKSLRTVDPSR